MAYSHDPAPAGIRAGQTLVVDDGGVVSANFNAGLESTVVVAGGDVGSNFEALGAQVTISGGLVGDFFDAFRGSAVAISGGSFGRYFNAKAGSSVNISGGSLGGNFDARGGSTVNISGGSFGDLFKAWGGSEVNLFGTQFDVDGTDLTPSLTLNVPFTFSDRDVTLSGILADGSPFSFDLKPYETVFSDYFDLEAFLTVTLVQPGDFDGDGDVDGDDFLAWQAGFNRSRDSRSQRGRRDWHSADHRPGTSEHAPRCRT